jgi:hypothetical protein
MNKKQTSEMINGLQQAAAKAANKRKSTSFAIPNERNQYDAMKDVLNSEHVLECVSIESVRHTKEFIRYEISCPDDFSINQVLFSLGTNFGAMLHKRKLVQVKDAS